MPFKIFSGIVAASLLILFVAPVVLKLKELSLAAVALIGVTMMLFDLWQAIRSGED
ncbi:MAG: hypothetical protein ACO3F9_08190 [Burkholderiales bacterium]